MFSKIKELIDDSNNIYIVGHVDPDGEETVKWFKIQYLKNEAKALLKDRYYRLKAENKTSNQQLSLF